MKKSVDLDQILLKLFASIHYLVNNVIQLYAADDVSRRPFQMIFFDALRVKISSGLSKCTSSLTY